MNVNEYIHLIVNLENERKSEREIINILEQKLLEMNWDRDECFTINDVLISRGYKYRFKALPILEKKEFDKYEYANLVRGVGKSYNQTLKLMQYLREVRDFRLAFSSMHFIKMKFLIQAGLMNIDNPLLDQFKDLDLYETYFTCIHHSRNKDCKQIIRHIEKEILPLIGEEYAYQDFDYKNFEIDMEYLLYTITLTGDKDAYKRINTIKVALNINDPEWHVWGIDRLKFDTCKTKKEQNNLVDKGTYYFKNIVKEFIPSLNKIDKNIAKSVAKTYEEFYEELTDDGYKVLYMLLCE